MAERRVEICNAKPYEAVFDGNIAAAMINPPLYIMKALIVYMLYRLILAVETSNVLPVGRETKNLTRRLANTVFRVTPKTDDVAKPRQGAMMDKSKARKMIVATTKTSRVAVLMLALRLARSVARRIALFGANW